MRGALAYRSGDRGHFSLVLLGSLEDDVAQLVLRRGVYDWTQQREALAPHEADAPPTTKAPASVGSRVFLRGSIVRMM